MRQLMYVKCVSIILNEIDKESTKFILTLIHQIGKYGSKINISEIFILIVAIKRDCVGAQCQSGVTSAPDNRSARRLVAQDGTNPSSGDAIAAHRA